jgi:alpha-glucosidase
VRTLHFCSVKLLLAAFCFLGSEIFAQQTTLSSPDGKIRITVQLRDSGLRENPSWSATFQKRQLFTNCALALNLTEGGDLLKGARLIGMDNRAVKERVPIPFGKADHGNNHFRELRLNFQTRGQQPLAVVFRCFDDAIAFRYELGGSNRTVTIADENSSFGVEGDPTAYIQVLENYTTSHEHTVAATRYADIRQGDLLDMPLTLTWPDGTAAAFTEAALRHYAGMALAKSADGRLVSKLTPRPDGTKVVRPLPLQTPWRVVLLASRIGALLESTTIYCLNEPSAVRDISWIKPGKITFHWWNGDVYDGQPGEPILSFEMAKNYIDFCARNGIPTHSMSSTEKTTSPWYFQSNPGTDPGPDTDVTRPRDGFDLARIKKYADSQNVRLWTWVHQKALRGRVEEAFTAFERLGWSGMMVDFFDHDDQDSVEFAESILEAAARHHIMIHLHGIWKPTGLERTYPNLMNHEGALNLEYLKWSSNCTPEHDLNMAFTRLVAGPMDYHLGGFRASPRSEFKPQHIAPNVLGTRARMLAMYVCFDNPNPMAADYPAAYEHQPGFDFLVLVPTWWDETKIVQGEIGKLLVTARRKGKTWYLGGMSAGGAREVNVPLGFLPSGGYAAKIWKDSSDTDPNALSTESLSLTRSGSLKVRLASDGGFVAEVAPAP